MPDGLKLAIRTPLEHAVFAAGVTWQLSRLREKFDLDAKRNQLFAFQQETNSAAAADALRPRATRGILVGRAQLSATLGR